MKLCIIGWRPWSVVMRYRSLITNARQQGHKVFGIATGHYSMELVRLAFESLGVEYVCGWPRKIETYMGWVNKISPDAFFGEQYWSCITERECKKWADAHGRKRVVVDHGGYWTDFTHHCHVLNNRDTIAVVNETAAHRARKKTKARVAVIGAPELDVLAEPHNIGEIRKRLGTSDNQALVAVFLSAPNRMHKAKRQATQIAKEPERTARLMDMAKIEGWKVVVHLHPWIRSGRTSIGARAMIPYLQRMQDRGALFASSVISGTANGIKFMKCNQAELITAADAIVGSSVSTGPIAYAVGKKYFYYPKEELPMGVFEKMVPAASKSTRDYLSMPNVVRIDGDFAAFATVIAGGDTLYEKDDEYTRRVFHRIDGGCWERLLNLAAK